MNIISKCVRRKFVDLWYGICLLSRIKLCNANEIGKCCIDKLGFALREKVFATF